MISLAILTSLYLAIIAVALQVDAQRQDREIHLLIPLAVATLGLAGLLGAATGLIESILETVSDGTIHDAYLGNYAAAFVAVAGLAQAVTYGLRATDSERLHDASTAIGWLFFGTVGLVIAVCGGIAASGDLTYGWTVILCTLAIAGASSWAAAYLGPLLDENLKLWREPWLLVACLPWVLAAFTTPFLVGMPTKIAVHALFASALILLVACETWRLAADPVESS